MKSIEITDPGGKSDALVSAQSRCGLSRTAHPDGPETHSPGCGCQLCCVREALRGYFIWALVSNSTPTDSVVVLESIIGAAVVAAASLSPEFKLAVAQVALVHISDEKQRRFLADRGWNV